MSTQILSNSPHLYVQGGPSMSWINMNNPSAGMMRYNGNTNSTEVYDGNCWMQLNHHYSIQTSSDLNETVAWAKKKMAEEATLKILCEKFPALQKALDNFEMIKALVENEDLTTAV